MISRRALMATGAGVATLAACPVLARAGLGGLAVVDPTLLTGLVPSGALAARGPDLLHALLGRVGERGRIEAVVDAADAAMLAELLRFRPRLSLRADATTVGAMTPLGRLARPAHHVVAAWG